MAGKHRSRERHPLTKPQRSGGLRSTSGVHEPYKWLGAGAVTLGVGMALASGSGFAHADTASPYSANGSPTDETDASLGATSSAASADSASTDSTETSATTGVTTPAAQSPAPAEATPPNSSSGTSASASTFSGGNTLPDATNTPTDSAATYPTTSVPTPWVGIRGVPSVVPSTAAANPSTRSSSGPSTSSSSTSSATDSVAPITRNPLGAKAQMANASVYVAPASTRNASPAAIGPVAPEIEAATFPPVLSGLAALMGVNLLGPLGTPVPASPAPLTEILWAAFRSGEGTTTRQSLAATTNSVVPTSVAAESTQESNYGTYKTISLNGTPTNVAISASGGRAWAVVDGKVEMIDISNSTPVVSAVVTAGNNPNMIAASANGNRAYVTNSSDGTVSIIDIDGAGKPVLTTVAVGSNPTGITVNSSGTRAYVANTGSNTVTIIDYSTPLLPGIPNNPRVTTVNVGSGPTSVVTNATGTVAYVTNSDGNTVSIINDNGFGSPTVTNIEVSAAPTSVRISETGTKAVVYSQGGIISIVDTSGAMPVVTQVPGSHVSYVDDPGFIAISADGSKAFVTEHDARRVAIINTATPGDAPLYASFDDYPHSIVAYRTGALAFTVAHDALYVIDTKTGAAVAVPIPADNDSSQYQRVAISSNGSRVIAVDNSGNLTVFYYTSSDGSAGPDGGQSLKTLIDTFLNPTNGVFVQIAGLGQAALEVIGHAGEE